MLQAMMVLLVVHLATRRTRKGIVSVVWQVVTVKKGS
jgi:hypothetical protein